MNERLARVRLNWMDREDIAARLAAVGIHSDDDEPLEDLKEAVVESINDGDMTVDDLPECDGDYTA